MGVMRSAGSTIRLVVCDGYDYSLVSNCLLKDPECQQYLVIFTSDIWGKETKYQSHKSKVKMKCCNERDTFFLSPGATDEK